MKASSNTDTRLATGLFIARVITGLVFIMHGYQKLFENGVNATQDGFAAMGVPFPEIAAVGLIALELAGGVALILGVWTRIAGALLSIAMLGAIYFAHLDGGFFARDGGYEYVLVLVALSAVLALTGPGAWSLERVLHWSPPAPAIASSRR